jgi:hypothetical protein
MKLFCCAERKVVPAAVLESNLFLFPELRPKSAHLLNRPHEKSSELEIFGLSSMKRKEISSPRECSSHELLKLRLTLACNAHAKM